MLHYDKILTSIGEFGSYQRRICFILCVFVIQTGVHIGSTIFNNITPPFRCAVPDLYNDTYAVQNNDHQRLVSDAIPYDKKDGQFSNCHVLTTGHIPIDNRNETGRNSSSACDMWVYDGSTVSMVVEFNLVCERTLYKAHINMVMLLGMLVGSLLGGPLSDHFGRKKLIFVGILVQTMIASVLAGVQDLVMVLVCRFFVSCVGIWGCLSVVVLLTELVGVSRRSIAATFSMFGYSLGLLYTTLIQYLFREWRTAQLIQSLPFLAFVLCWRLIPESPRWLLTKGRNREAETIIKHMAAVNRTELTVQVLNDGGTEMIQSPDESCEETAKNDEVSEDLNSKPKEIKIWHLCSRLDIAVRISILCFSWIAINMVYYGLVLGVGDLIPGNIYINVTLQSVMDLLGNAICVLVLEKTGRKKIFCSSMVITGTATLGIALTVLLHADMRWLSIMFYCIGKLCITVAFSLIYIVTTELLPTTIRNSGLGFCSFVARFSGLISPYIVSVSLFIPGAFGRAFPLILFGAISLISGLTAILLPETRNAKLPETFDDNNDKSPNRV